MFALPRLKAEEVEEEGYKHFQSSATNETCIVPSLPTEPAQREINFRLKMVSGGSFSNCILHDQGKK